MIECIDKSFDVFFFAYVWERDVKGDILAKTSFLEILLIVITGNGVRVLKFLMHGQQKIQEEIKGIVKMILIVS
jgi:hypothetical protein